MLKQQEAQAIAQLYDAARTPGFWSSALQQLATLVGGIGAGHVVYDRRTGSVDWVTLTGPCAEFEPKYASYYAPRDLFAPILVTMAPGRWLPLSRCVSATEAKRNPWYNDFILKTGVADCLAVKVYEDEDTGVLLGIQRAPSSDKAAASFNARVRSLLGPLTRAARLHVDFHRMGRTLSAANQALQYLSAGVVLTDSDGRVLEMNDLASNIVRSEDGLVVRDGRLTAIRNFEASKLAASIAGKAQIGKVSGDGHMLIGRRRGAQPYAVTIAPLAGGTNRRSNIVMVLIVNLDWHAPSERSVAEFFGLSPAESRLASALLKGRKLNDIAKDSGVEICTLRTQLSSILRKVGVERQVDLVRILASIGSTAPHSA